VLYRGWDLNAVASTKFARNNNTGGLFVWPPLWSSGQEFLATDPEFLVWFLALPDFPRSSGSGTGSTQPREYYWGATSKKK
jgi:hypothetical protein